MKIVVIGGTGLIGKALVSSLRAAGHDALAASPSTGVDTVTGKGLAEALQGADVLVDVSNSPSFEDVAVMRFFETSTRNLVQAARAAGVGHYVALSVVGADRVPDSGYLRAKVAQETLITDAAIPYSIVRATQFFEFIVAIAYGSTQGDEVRLPSALFQPLAAADVSSVLHDVVLAKPSNATVDIAGPDRLPMDRVVRDALAAQNDPRRVIGDPNARYFGAVLQEDGLVPTGPMQRTNTTLSQWLARK